MIQAIVKKGKVIGEEIPAPNVTDGSLLIKVVNSCISAGTEMSGVQASSGSIIKKALKQPEKIVKALNMIRTSGFSKTYAVYKGKFETGSATGYSISGIVLGVGKGVKEFEVGDAVAAAGAGLANHAEYVDVPQNLVMKMPAGMSFVDASTVTLGGIALQGIRRADLKLGEFCVVLGTGILGLLSIQMLRLSGVRVIAIDLDNRRLDIAKEFGAEIAFNPKETDILKTVLNYTGGYGTDAVLFTAATGSSAPLSQAFQMCKRKGRVILVGVSGMEIKREDIYPKELDFSISTSYGPGRYDNNYEGRGLNYPYAYVRWTENRNMTEYLRLVSKELIRLEKMIDAVRPISEITEAFDSLKVSEKKPLMVILDYGKPNMDELDKYLNHDRKVIVNKTKIEKGIINVALIGAGDFAAGMHLPTIEKLNRKYKLYAVVDINGVRAKAIAQQYNANFATTDVQDVLSDKSVDLVLITTRHDSHGSLTLEALRAGKNVFVEKPLAVNKGELDEISEFFNGNNKPILMVGFNRRFSKYAEEIKNHTSKRINPLFLHYRMNAGYIPLDHWVHESGGRIVGECCHIIDLMTFFTESKIDTILFEEITPKNEKISSSDNKSIILKYQDGSIATIEYFAVGNRLFPKEYMEVHFDEKTIVMEDYKTLKAFGIKVNEITTPKSEKGHCEELFRLYDTLKGKTDKWPIDLRDLMQTAMTTFLLI